MQTARTLTDEQLAQFDDLGYLVLSEWLSDDQIERLKADVDELQAAAARDRDRVGMGYKDGYQPYQMPAIGELTWNPKTLEVVESLMAAWRPRAQSAWPKEDELPPFIGEATGSGRCVFHHVHAFRNDPGSPGTHWHQDYMQHPQTNRSHLMVYVFHYLNGLDGTVGDLMLVPRSQRTIVDRGALFHLGQAELPGSIAVNDIPPGSAVMVHGAIWHGRRAKPGGDRSRYFIDTSYCQSGVLWPSYHDQRAPGMLDELLQRHIAAGGTREWLFDKSQFFPSERALQLQPELKGSIITQLDDWKNSS